MTVKELASLTNKLYREGKGELSVYFKDGPIAYPITDISEEKILIGTEGPDVICLSFIGKEKHIGQLTFLNRHTKECPLFYQEGPDSFCTCRG